MTNRFATAQSAFDTVAMNASSPTAPELPDICFSSCRRYQLLLVKSVLLEMQR